jgi:sigma-B regulation protein RsbU (phosphoserine phosphatase)
VAGRGRGSPPPLSLIFRHRVYIFSDPNAEGSPHRRGLLPRRGAAALVVGRRPSRHVIFFLLADDWILEEVDFTLNTVRAALGSRLLDARTQGTFREAAEIQQSLLLEEPPDFPGFETACRSIPAEEVGGDFFDFQVFDQDILGLSIGDASGHGLPAALLVRDVVTGMRMGIEKELKVTHVFAKLNRVIHRSNLSSRFVSVFYGELEGDGNLTYVNAGHPPPLLFFEDPTRDPSYMELATGGTVIGPLPEVRFKRGFARLRPREGLVLCTDGILERRNPRGEFFGSERLRAVVREKEGRSAGEILDRLFEAALSFGDGRPWEDDATAVVVRRNPA